MTKVKDYTLMYSVREYDHALKESLKLQAHYAQLLNDHDGGKRIIFKDIQSWMRQLGELEDAKPFVDKSTTPHKYNRVISQLATGSLYIRDDCACGSIVVYYAESEVNLGKPYYYERIDSEVNSTTSTTTFLTKEQKVCTLSHDT